MRPGKSVNLCARECFGLQKDGRKRGRKERSERRHECVDARFKLAVALSRHRPRPRRLAEKGGAHLVEGWRRRSWEEREWQSLGIEEESERKRATDYGAKRTR